MPIYVQTDQPKLTDREPNMHRLAANRRWIAGVMATLAMLAIWIAAQHLPAGDMDGQHYLAMADGQQVTKPFAFRFLIPAVVRVARHITGCSSDRGLLVVGLIAGWVLFFGVLSLVIERGKGMWLAVVLATMPFWLRIFIDYQLPDLPHAALLMIYLLLLRRRKWGWASLMLAVMYLTRESTLLIALIAIPVLWRLAGRRAGLMQAAAALAGMILSKFGARHALPNRQHMNDTLYMIGKIPWNLSKNIFGVTLWSNTIPYSTPSRVWAVPHWLHTGGLHAVGYSGYNWGYQAFTFGSILSSFGIGFVVVLCLWWRTSPRWLLPRDQPYLWIAAIYGAAAYFLAPMLGAGETRLLDYGWPLFLVYLPAAMLAIWRDAPRRTVYALIALNFIDAWSNLAQQILQMPWIYNIPVYLCCNIAAAWLLLKTKPPITKTLMLD